MKQYMKNNNGSALLMAVAVLILFTALGLMLMTLTSNGLAKNESRENIIQATDLADKGIEFITTEIQTELNNYIRDKNINKKQFKEKLNSLINDSRFECDKEGIEITGELGTSRVCIDNSPNDEVYFENEDDIDTLNGLKKKVHIKSTGIVNGKEVTTTTTTIFGTDPVPDQLRYAISSNNGGNIFLHGGVEIHGDIKTDNNLILSRQASWPLNFIVDFPQWRSSVRTKIVPGPGSTAPKVIFSKENKAVYDLKQFKDSFIGEYEDHINGNNLEKTSYYTKHLANTNEGQNNISNLFFNSPQISVVTNTNLPQDTVEIINKIQEKYNLSTNKENHLKNLHIKKDYISNNNKQDVIFVSDTDKNGGYKFGNMKIDNSGKFLGLSKSNVTLKGTYYVYGDLTIENVNLTADAIIYVQGKVDISDSTIKGIDKKNNSTLIIFSNGDIEILKMSTPVFGKEREASKIKGFFYTKQDMVMYGVYSHINLTGGISARRLILSGVRGETPNVKNQEVIENGIAKHYSRLKIIYDQDLISTYTEFIRDEEEEFINSISPPEIIKRD